MSELGTRHLIQVIRSGEIVVAQYGQWDGYLEGQGRAIAQFLHSPEFSMDLFRSQLDRCRFVDGDVAGDIMAEHGFPHDGLMTMEDADRLKVELPQFSRDTCADILPFIYEYEDEVIYLTDSSDFATDTVWCEWVYTIDVDHEIVVVKRNYTGTERAYPISAFDPESIDGIAAWFELITLPVEAVSDELPFLNSM